jgi:hypothetical protein
LVVSFGIPDTRNVRRLIALSGGGGSGGSTVRCGDFELLLGGGSFGLSSSFFGGRADEAPRSAPDEECPADRRLGFSSSLVGGRADGSIKRLGNFELLLEGEGFGFSLFLSCGMVDEKGFLNGQYLGSSSCLVEGGTNNSADRRGDFELLLEGGGLSFPSSLACGRVDEECPADERLDFSSSLV